MSQHPEFHDLEERLRQKRPSVTPPRAAFKRSLRANLLERIEMKEKQTFGFRQIVSFAGAAVLIVALPLFFWLSLGSQSPTGAAPAAAPTDLPPTALPPTAVSVESEPGPLPTAVPTLVPTEVPTALAPTAAEAAAASQVSLTRFADPVAQEDGSPFKEVDVTLDYYLAGYEEGVIVLEWQSEDGLFNATDQIGVVADETTTTMTLVVGPDKFSSDGSLSDNLVFTPHLWGLDPLTGEYVHLLPQMAPDTAAPRVPHSPYYVGIHQLAYDAAAGELTVGLNSQIQIPRTVSATVALLDGGEVVAETTTSLTNSNFQTEVTLTLSDTSKAAVPLTLVWQLEAAELSFDQSRLDVTLDDFINLAPNSVQVAHTETLPEGEQLYVTFLILYNLSDPYTSGNFAMRSSFVSANGGGGGGGGGGAPLTELGTFGRIFTTSLPADALTAEQSWEDVLNI
ncbi:MAG: hypothetical protein KDE51_23615, partial [Anaerolineales bacterium]|nr:hypothetical protein [Anaerolineales bacterium]